MSLTASVLDEDGQRFVEVLRAPGRPIGHANSAAQSGWSCWRRARRRSSSAAGRQDHWTRSVASRPPTRRSSTSEVAHRTSPQSSWTRDLTTSRCSTLSTTGLDVARERLGGDADRVHWIAQRRARLDARTAATPCGTTARCCTSSLTPATGPPMPPSSREALTPDGHAIIATFALDGPDHCSGQPVHRYSTPTTSSSFSATTSRLLAQRSRHPPARHQAHPRRSPTWSPTDSHSCRAGRGMPADAARLPLCRRTMGYGSAPTGRPTRTRAQH